MFKVDDHGWKEVFENFGDVLEQKGVTMPNWDRQAYEKLEQYIRSQIFKSTPITELFISQRKALEKVLSKEGAVVSMPTSSGKTRIAEIVILQCLMFDTTSRVLYIAPFRSLAYEMEETLGNTFNPLDYHVTHLYGGAQYTAIDRYEMESARVLIATPEKAKAILRANIEVVSSIKLIVMDEGHLLGKHERDITNEMFTEELRRIIRKNRGKFLVLSAVLPNAQDISKWLVGDENQVVKDCWRPSTQRIGLMRYHNNKIDLEWLGGYNCFNNSFVKTTNDKKTAIAEAAMKLLPLG
jgi:replicative superfamily II helicase